MQVGKTAVRGAVTVATVAALIGGVFVGSGAAAAGPRSCGTVGGFKRVVVNGVTCRYAAKTFVPAYRRRGKVAPSGWRCATQGRPVQGLRCRRRDATITLGPPSTAGPPTSRQYRVYADLELKLGAGVTYTLSSVGGAEEQCVNDRKHGSFVTEKDVDPTVVWFDASESAIPPCWDQPSRMSWEVTVGRKAVIIRVRQLDEGAGYHATCEPVPHVPARLNCETHNAGLGFTVSP
jgi:hypothetical protein